MEKSLGKNNFFTPLVKGCFAALCFSLASILLFAVFLRFCSIPDIVIKIINQIIKILSVFFGVYFVVKKDPSRGFLKGAFIGCSYTIVSYFIFSILIQNFSFSASLIYDLIFSVIVGVVCGVFLINLKKQR